MKTNQPYVLTLKSAGAKIKAKLPLGSNHMFWRLVSPIWYQTLDAIFHDGVEIRINETETLRVSAKFCDLADRYEPDVFRHLLEEIRPKDTVVEVGGYVGIYTIPMAKRLEPPGRVIVLEPAPDNYAALTKHLTMNQVRDRTVALPFAADTEKGDVSFSRQAFSSSYVLPHTDANA